MAELSFLFGTMGCGKSLQLLANAHSCEEQGQNVLYLTSAVDDRFGVGVITSRFNNNSLQHEAIAISHDADVFSLVKENFPKTDTIFVDEVNFFGREQIDQLSNIALYLDIEVNCYGIRSDFQRNLFVGSKALFELADTTSEIKLKCKCGRNAVFNMRIIDGKPVFDGPQIYVGSSYMPVCKFCYNRYKSGEITLKDHVDKVQKIVYPSPSKIK